MGWADELLLKGEVANTVSVPGLSFGQAMLAKIINVANEQNNW